MQVKEIIILKKNMKREKDGRWPFLYYGGEHNRHLIDTNWDYEFEQCRVCHQIKPTIGNFYKHPMTQSGFDTVCNDCRKKDQINKDKRRV